MKTILAGLWPSRSRTPWFPTLLSLIWLGSPPHAAPGEVEFSSTKPSEPIPWSAIGARAGTDYKGDGLAVVPTRNGARLRCTFQKLEGEATREGLWLSSTVANVVCDRFRVMAAQVGRVTPCAPGAATRTFNIQHPTSNTHLDAIGTISLVGHTVRFTRPGLVEEYTVSMDGVRQDFLVLERPAGAGELAVRMAVSGAQVEQTTYGANLVVGNSGRKIAYSRLRVTDATGRELTARMEVMGSARVPRAGSGVAPEPLSGVPNGLVPAANGVGRDFRRDAENDTPEARAPMLLVMVNDTDAVYPIRIDPTFSDANWISMGGFPGADGPVHAAVVDGSGNLYIGGEFTIVGDTLATRIAKWDGSHWTALGLGMDSSVNALAVSGTDLYAAGWFTTATNSGGGTVTVNRVAKWDGSSWSALGEGLNSSVEALAVSGSDVYAGGIFTTAGGSAANYIAKWDGSNWSALGLGMNNWVDALAVLGSDVYAGGSFTTAGGSAANRIAKWDGSSWSSPGLGMNSSVEALAVSGSDLYAGGNFTTVTNSGGGTVTVNHIAKWDGSSWSALGSGLSGLVDALAVSGSDLYAGGNFTMAGGTAANNIAKWDGNSWSALGSGIDGDTGPTAHPLAALAVLGSDLYAGGYFTTADGGAAKNIAKWDGSSWSSPGLGLGGIVPSVRALAVSGGDVYAGGGFTTAGGIAANYIAKWDGSSWSALGSGLSDLVQALAVSGSDVYAGGNITTATNSSGETVTVNRVAKWDGSHWTALGLGMDFVVSALAVLGSDLYVGGFFRTATNLDNGTVTVNRIAKWDGSSWSALGAGLNNRVYALAVLGSDLYVGGVFTTATNLSGGTVTVNRVAKWDGNSWSALGSGVDNTVFTLAISGSDVYAGGFFTTAGGIAANHIAKWDGSGWSALGAGLDSRVPALTVSGSDVYAGGDFFTAGGTSANSIARWDGSSWSALGSGLNGSASALAVLGSDLYAGGSFTTAGGKVSAYVARAVIVLPANPIPPWFFEAGDFVSRFDGTPGVTYTIECTPTLGPADWQKVTNLTAPTMDLGQGIGVFEFREPVMLPGNRFYRSVYPPY